MEGKPDKKRVKLTITIEVDDGLESDDLREFGHRLGHRLEDAFREGDAATVTAGPVQVGLISDEGHEEAIDVRAVPRDRPIAENGGGYESRLWEKATC
jgi:hypothetical protein